MFDVVMAGEGPIAVESLEAVAVREAANFLQDLRRFAAAEAIEDAQMLLGARRRVDPGNEALITLRRLADAETPAVPDEFEVVGEIERIQKLVRRREDRDRAAVALRDDRAMPRGNRRGRLLECRRYSSQLIAGVEPGNRFPVRLCSGQPGVVEDGTGVFFGADDGLSVNEPAAGIDGET